MKRLATLSLLMLVCCGAVAYATDDTVIVIGNQEVLRIRADSGGLTAKQRAAALRERIVEIYQKLGKANVTLSAKDVTLDLTPGRPAIRVRGMLLLSVTEEDARDNECTIEELARLWHQRLRAALVKEAPQPEP